jgi:hypothetical protein
MRAFYPGLLLSSDNSAGGFTCNPGGICFFRRIMAFIDYKRGKFNGWNYFWEQVGQGDNERGC